MIVSETYIRRRCSDWHVEPISEFGQGFSVEMQLKMSRGQQKGIK
jgi:hypothetical protein